MLKTVSKTLLLTLLVTFTCKAQELNSLTLLSPKTQPLKDTNLTLHVKNKNNQFITKNITWITTPKNTIKENGTNVITPIKDTDITLQAQYNDKLSNKITLSVKWIVNNHELPPEPDPKINNSTLLGIDVNNNGVRDDVERWIYEEFDEYIPCKEVPYEVKVVKNGITYITHMLCEDKPKKYHQIVREIGMQAARAAQIVIQEPKRALETTVLMSKVVQCDAYFSVYAQDYNESIGLEDSPAKDFENAPDGKKFDEIQFNTIQRARAYGEYNFNLSGNVFDIETVPEKLRKACDFDVDRLLKEGR